MYIKPVKGAVGLQKIEMPLGIGGFLDQWY